MKRLWAAAAILLFLTGSCFVNAWYARQLTDRLTGQLNQSCRLAQLGQWEEALTITRRAADQWEDARLYRSVLLSQGDTDHISRSFSDVLIHLDSHSGEYRASCLNLILQLKDLGATEQLRLHNIL